MTSWVDHSNAATSQSDICFLSSLWLTCLKKSKLRAVLIDGNNSWTALENHGHGKSVKVNEKVMESHGISESQKRTNPVSVMCGFAVLDTDELQLAHKTRK